MGLSGKRKFGGGEAFGKRGNWKRDILEIREQWIENWNSKNFEI